jgi:hypothetical protein
VLKTVSKLINTSLLLAVNEVIFYYSLITQPVSHACSCLFSSRHNNQPFRNAIEKVGKQSFQWAERLTEMGAQFWTTELGRARNMTRQTRGRKGCSKNDRAHLEDTEKFSHGRRP